MKRLRRMKLVYTTAAFALIRLLFILLMHLDVGFFERLGKYCTVGEEFPSASD